ncbi:MAG: N-acetylmuramoyl-L-alanine amidase [Chloroflexi bacterium]|nr:N-acetylmuramoyl-L-alanine amidase [Chloroflexota bacterium]
MIRALLVGLALALALSVLAFGSSTSAAGRPLVCLDPGHGGSAPGATNGSLREAEINLDVSLALSARLADVDIDSVLTRTGDSTKSARDRYEFCNSALADLFVGVHTNSVANSITDGTLTIYFHNDDKVLAGDLQEAMLARLAPTSPDPDSFIDFGLKKDALGVVLKTDMPGAVVEPVFMSNTGEALRLLETVEQCFDPTDNECRRAQIVEALFDGITAYFAAHPVPTATNTPGGPTPTPTPEAEFCPPGHQRRGIC